MSPTLLRTVVFLLLAIMSSSAIRSTGFAQEADEGHGQRRRTRPSIVPSPRERGTFGRQGADQSAGEATLSKEPQKAIALTVWVLTFGKSAKPAADDLGADLVERLVNRPNAYQSIDEVRESVSRLKGAESLRNSREYRIVALDGQSASAQVGSNLPRVIATATSESVQTNSITYEPTGTLIKLRPLIDAEGYIQVSLHYAASHMEKSNDTRIMIPAAGDATFADVIVTSQINTTARLKSGTAVVVHNQAFTGSESGGAGGHTKLVLLGAQLVESAE